MKAFEQLEPRLNPGACTPLAVLQIIQAVDTGNDAAQYDLNADGMVSPLDALVAINYANRGSQPPLIVAGTESRGNGVLFGSVSGSLGPCYGPAFVQVIVGGQSENVRLMRPAGPELPVAKVEAGNRDVWVFEPIGRGTEIWKVLGDVEQGVSVSLMVG